MQDKPLVKIKLEQFEGPLDLLLQLIEHEKLPITELSIGQVTEQYLRTLRQTEGGMHPEILADFLVVAARLLYLKSRVFFPSRGFDEGEEDVSLEAQLKLYQRFVEASKVIEKLFHQRQYLFVRDRLGGLKETVFAPPASLSRDRMHAIMMRVIEGLATLVSVPKAVINKTISLRDTIRKIEELLRQRDNLRFGSLFTGETSRTEIVVIFLALLELMKQRTVVVRQEVMFEEMTIEKL